MSAATGADVESICSKCGDVWHVVVAKVGDKIVKVQCKQCHGFHRYKPPPGKEPLKPLKAAKAGAVVSATGAKPKAKRAKKSTEPAPPAVAPDMSKPVRYYSPLERYTPGERVSHTTFGAGVVEGSPGAGKIQVVFPGGRRILASARDAMNLEKPTNKPRSLAQEVSLAQSSQELHEDPTVLSDEVKDRHRAIVSIMEELEAVDWYDQRVHAASDPELAAILAHNRDEEKEHAVMTLEWLRRRDAKLDAALKTYLFSEGSVLDIEKKADAAGGGGGGSDGSLGLGSLRGKK